MVILVTGARGLIGSRLVPELERAGHTVVRAVRRPPRSADEVQWTPSTGALDPSRPIDAVVYVAGHSIAAGRWTRQNKARIWSSRVDATRVLCERLAADRTPPRVMVSSSGVDIYGDRGDETLDESSPHGQGFLADLGNAWEAAVQPLREAGCRIVSLRLGLVLSREGGAFPRLLLPARFGLGGPLGSGRQFWSWIAMDDAVAAFLRALDRPGLAGPVNGVAPNPVRQREFARVLGRVLRRPAFMPVPAWALRLILGEMANGPVLGSARVLPRRLEADGFRFAHPDLEGALRATLSRAVDDPPRRRLGSPP